MGKTYDMAKHKIPKNLKPTLWIMAVLLLLVAVAQIIFGQQVKAALARDIPGNLALTYGNRSTNVLLGKIALEDLALRTKDGTMDLRAKRLVISGLRYLPLLQKGNFTLARLELEAPHLYFRKPKMDTLGDPSKKKLPSKIAIAKVQVDQGHLEIFREGSESILTKIEHIDLQLGDLSMNGNPGFPIVYGLHSLKTQKGFLDLGRFEVLQWQRLEVDTLQGHILNMQFHTKYGIGELSQKLAKERDHYDLWVDSLSMGHPVFSPGASPARLHISQLGIYRPEFQVYRDKLLPDDTTHKKLYNQALRDLELDLRVDTIAISGGSIAYRERLDADVEPERLSFTDISAGIYNLHNKGKGPVEVDIAAQLMGSGPLTLDWSFDPADKGNAFVARASLLDFDTRDISPFLRSNLNSEVQGRIDRLYFTISGHELESLGDIKMDYGEFDFVVLKKDRSGVNKLLTAVVNLFAKDGGKDDVDGFRHGTFKVKRNTDRSFFNYLWINLKAGLVNTLTGKGHKEKK